MKISEMTVYENLERIYDKAVKKNPAFLQRHKEDFTKVDKDTILNEAQAGDEYIAILKAEGTGTWLARFDCEEKNNNALVKTQNSGVNSRFYHLKFSGINKGTVMEVSQIQAITLSKTVKAKVDRVPRRDYVFSLLDKAMGLKSELFGTLSGTHFGSKFQSFDNEVTAIKLSSDGYNGAIAFARTKVNKENVGAELNGVYTVPVNLEKTEELLEPKYFKLSVEKAPYATLTEISEHVYNSSVTKSRNLRGEKEASLGLN